MNVIRSLRVIRLRTAFANQMEHYSVYSRRSVPLSLSKNRSSACINGEVFSKIKTTSLVNKSISYFPMSTATSEKIIEEKITVIGEGAVAAVENFSDIEWPNEVMKVLEKQGYTKPTTVQANCWPIILSGKDLVGIAKTGCGKTLAYLLPAISYIAAERNNQSRKERSPLALVLAPTRELTQQIAGVAKQFESVIKSISVFGGASKLVQSNFINQHNPELIIATPGRLIDLVQSGAIDTSQVQYLVLDEADRMLDMGFEPQIREIVRNVPEDRQTLMFSATWPEEVKELANDFLNDFIQINVGSTELYANPNITQNIEIIESESIVEKKNRLRSILEDVAANEEKVIIFTEKKRTVDALSRWLRSQRYFSVGLHGDKSQYQRDTIMRDFRSGRCNILVATDVASRGIDVSDVKCVINFDFPLDIEDYVHRIGRTARANNKGFAYSFFTAADAGRARDLIKIMEKANQEVPPQLRAMAASAAQQAAQKKRNKYMRSRSQGNFEFNFKSRPGFRTSPHRREYNDFRSRDY